MKYFILDVDGVMTTGQFLYNDKGKAYKIFGADDHDALKITKKYLKILFISADKKGFNISKKRIVDDMNFPLHYVSNSNRLNWIKENYNTSEVIYMGDGISDYKIFEQVAYSIAPSNSDFNTISKASFVTQRSGGDRAVAEACKHILKKFFKIKDIL